MTPTTFSGDVGAGVMRNVRPWSGAFSLRVFRLAMRVTGNAARADEATAAVLVKVWTNASQVERRIVGPDVGRSCRRPNDSGRDPRRPSMVAAKGSNSGP